MTYHLPHHHTASIFEQLRDIWHRRAEWRRIMPASSILNPMQVAADPMRVSERKEMK